MEQQLNKLLWPSNNNYYIVSDCVTEVVEMTCVADLHNTDLSSVFHIGVMIMNDSYHGHVYLVPDIGDAELKPLLQEHRVERPRLYSYLVLTAESYEKTGKAGILNRIKLCEDIKAICELRYITHLIT